MPGTTGVRPAVDGSCGTGLDDVAFFEMWHGIVPSLASLCGFSGLNFLQELVYTANK